MLSIISQDRAAVAACMLSAMKNLNVIEAVLALQLQLCARDATAVLFLPRQQQPTLWRASGLEERLSKTGTVYRPLDATGGNQIRQASCKGFDCDDGGAWFGCVVLVWRALHYQGRLRRFKWKSAPARCRRQTFGRDLMSANRLRRSAGKENKPAMLQKANDVKYLSC